MTRHCNHHRALRSASRAGLAVALFSAAVPVTAGCKKNADHHPLMQRLAEAPIAFIGRVEAVAKETVRFAVEHPIGGVADQVVTVPRATVGCAFAFAGGDRWLYAGDASVRLGRADESGADAIGRLRRSDDALLQLPAAWQACQSSAQCVTIGYGCSATAAAAPYQAEAKAQAWKIGGDPRSMDCSTPPPTVQRIQPLCVAGRCGIWSVHLQ